MSVLALAIWWFLQCLDGGTRSSDRIVATPFKPLYNDMSLLCLLFFLEKFLLKNASFTPNFIIAISLDISGSPMLNIFKLLLKNKAWGPNKTTILRDPTHLFPYIWGLFYILWTRIKISSQKTKGPDSVRANIANIRIHLKSFEMVKPRYLIWSIFSSTSRSMV